MQKKLVKKLKSLHFAGSVPMEQKKVDQKNGTVEAASKHEEMV